MRRNSIARLLYAASHHVEPYESFDELRDYWPDVGILLVHDEGDALQGMFELMHERGCWLPIVAYGVDPEPSRVADVIISGALDYLGWPFGSKQVAERLQLLSLRRESFGELRRRASHSQKLVDTLTPREREILFCLANGASNKSAAQELQISPRTVEIHRANMMGKLGVSHLGEAISIALYSDLSKARTDDVKLNPLDIHP
jgi:FixJ family two-component response regulator